MPSTDNKSGHDQLTLLAYRGTSLTTKPITEGLSLAPLSTARGTGNCGLGVVEPCPVDDVGEAAFDDPECFHAAVAAGLAVGEEVLCRRVPVDLRSCDATDGCVELTVPDPAQPMPGVVGRLNRPGILGGSRGSSVFCQVAISAFLVDGSMRCSSAIMNHQRWLARRRFRQRIASLRDLSSAILVS